jgi:hypothetical protein
VDGRLDEVVFRALETEPDRRYQRISAVKADVDSILRAETWAPEPVEPPQRGEPDLAMVQLETRGPAAGLWVMAILMFIHGVVCFPLLEKLFLYKDAVLVPLTLVFLALIGLVVVGAIKLARCHGYEWVMLAIILVMLPLGYHVFIGFPIGYWALTVLRRPEVKAVFALQLRRAQRARGSAPRATVPPPASAGARPVRSFFRSVFSMFVSQPDLAPQTTSEAAFSALAAESSPATGNRPHRQKPPRKWKGWAQWIGVGVLVCVVLAWMGADFGRPPRVQWNPATTENLFEGLLVGDLDELKTTLTLTEYELKGMKQVLQGADREYLEMELAHTRRHFDDAGHLIVTIAPFAEEVSQLETRVWAKLESLLSRFTLEKLKKQWPARGGLFPFGTGEARIEIWQEGSWYYWKVDRAKAGQYSEEANGVQLPRRYQRFWKGGPPWPRDRNLGK